MASPSSTCITSLASSTQDLYPCILLVQSQGYTLQLILQEAWPHTPRWEIGTDDLRTALESTFPHLRSAVQDGIERHVSTSSDQVSLLHKTLDLSGVTPTRFVVLDECSIG